MSDLLSDLRYALRTVARQPGFSLVVALTLSLGVGLNAAVFGTIDAMLLRPFRFPEQERLVIVWDGRRGTADRDPVAPGTFLDWRAQAHAIESMAAWEWWQPTLTAAHGGERVQGFRVSPGFFEILGAAPTAGRSFSPDEDRPGQDRVVVISDGLWRQRYGADPGAVGAALLIGGEPHTVVGVAPPGFDFPLGARIWAPLAFSPRRAADRELRSLTVIGRLARGRATADAQSEMDVLGRRLEQQYPATNRDRGPTVQSLSRAFREDSAAGLFGMLAMAAALVLLVACMNIAGLLVSRSVDRHRELTLRAALGATRARLARQLVTETAVLALLSSVAALLLTAIALDLLRSSLPAEITMFIEGWNHLRLGPGLALLIPAFALLTGLCIGVVPAVAALRGDPAATLKEAGRGSARGGRQRVRQALVVVEIGFAVALLVAATLTLLGGMRLVTQAGGFDPDGVLTLQVTLPQEEEAGVPPSLETVDALRMRLEELPEVERVAVANILPAAGWSPVADVEIEGQVAPDAASRPRIGYRTVSPGFFETLQIDILQGRSFSQVDRDGSLPVAIVSASTASRFWSGQDPLGRRLRLEGPGREWATIVGVAADVQMYNWWDGADVSAVYVPMRQAPPPGLLHVALRTRGDPGAAAASARSAVHAEDARFVLDRVRTQREAIDESSRSLRWLATLMAICGAIGAVLAILGIYSLMAHAVSQRRHEFAVRMALGATSGEIVRMTVRQAAVLTGIGLTGGVLLAVAIGRFMAGAMAGLFGVEAAAFVVVVPALGFVALVAAYVPARRALALDPATVLKE